MTSYNAQGSSTTSNAPNVADTSGPDVVIPESLAVYLADRFIATDPLDEVALSALNNFIAAAHSDGSPDG